MGEKCQLIVLLETKSMVFGNESLSCHMRVFPRREGISPGRSDVAVLFDGGTRSIDAEFTCLHPFILRVTFHRRGSLICKLDCKTDSERKLPLCSVDMVNADFS